MHRRHHHRGTGSLPQQQPFPGAATQRHPPAYPAPPALAALALTEHIHTHSSLRLGGVGVARAPCILYRIGDAGLPPPAVASQHAQRLFFFRVPTLFFFWPAVFSSYLQRIAPHPRTRAARTLARARTDDRATNERYDVRSAGVADWKTARRGNTKRTLAAAAGPSPRDLYRHALTMRPPRKVRPFVSFKLPGSLARGYKWNK